MVDVKVSNNEIDLNEREKKILEVFLLNLCAQANAQATSNNMAFNPLAKEKQDILHFQFALHSSIPTEKYGEFKEGMDRRIKSALKMCELPECDISYKENSYLNTNS
ncbi:MAG: hypothetical protein Q8934_23300 [Bacillota bacterium]|nr:hypothetical protein [Bacillota bacterium]